MTDPQKPTRIRYIVVALATVMAFLLYLDRVCISFLERFIREDLKLTTEQTGYLMSGFFVGYGLGQVPAGWLSDRFGARAMLALYILLWSAFTGLMGLAGSFPFLLIFWFGCGLTQAGAYPTSAGIVGKWVPFTARAQASSIIATGGRIGGFSASALTAYLLVTFTHLGVASWRLTLAVYAAAGVIVAGLFWLLVRNRPADHPGCNPLEVALIEQGRLAANPHGKVGTIPWALMIRSRNLWLSSISQFGTNFGWAFLITWLPRYLKDVHDVPDVERGWLAGLPMLVGMSGMVAGGWLTDRLTGALGLRWGRRLPMALTRFLAVAGYIACLFADSPGTATAAFCVIAVATDLGTASVWAFNQDIGGKHVGSVLGWGNMWGSVGVACSSVVLNWLIERSGFGWDAAFVACALAFLLSGVMAFGVDATVPIEPLERAENGGI